MILNAKNAVIVLVNLSVLKIKIKFAALSAAEMCSNYSPDFYIREKEVRAVHLVAHVAVEVAVLVDIKILAKTRDSSKKIPFN